MVISVLLNSNQKTSQGKSVFVKALTEVWQPAGEEKSVLSKRQTWRHLISNQHCTECNAD